MRLTAIVVGVVAVWTSACSGEAPLSKTGLPEAELSEAELSELELESLEQGLIARDDSALIEEMPVFEITLDGEPDDSSPAFELGEQDRCSPSKQMACDQCLASCDELCPIDEGGKPPTKCLACQRGCSKSCDRCVVF